MGQVLGVVLEPRGVPMMSEVRALIWRGTRAVVGRAVGAAFGRARQAATSNLARVVVCGDGGCLSQQLGP